MKFIIDHMGAVLVALICAVMCVGGMSVLLPSVTAVGEKAIPAEISQELHCQTSSKIVNLDIKTGESKTIQAAVKNKLGFETGQWYKLDVEGASVQCLPTAKDALREGRWALVHIDNGDLLDPVIVRVNVNVIDPNVIRK